MTSETLLNLEDNFKKFYLSNQREFKISVNEKKFDKEKVANELAKLAEKYYKINWKSGISPFKTKYYFKEFDEYKYKNEVIFYKVFENSCFFDRTIDIKERKSPYKNIINNFFKNFSGMEFNFSSKDENYADNMLDTIKKTIDDNKAVFKINVQNSEGKDNFCSSLGSFLRSSVELSKNDYDVIQKFKLIDNEENTQFNKFKCEFMFYPYK